MTQRRRFNTRERIDLFLRTDGVCASCGVRLEPGWHADHVEPFSRGGLTVSDNGQALCPACNLRKGDSMALVGSLPQTESMREWQQRFVDLIRSKEQSGERDFLLVATPGAGKTRAALRVAQRRLAEGSSARIIVVVPTDSLRKQWAEAAARIGIHLDPALSNRDGAREAEDYHGAVVTYAQVAMRPELFARFVTLGTLAIFDEVHHAGDSQAWGVGVQDAFNPAGFRLGLSGTPFRDKGLIPFVTYTPAKDGTSLVCKADYTYGYRQALTDGVCRPVLFASYDGTMTWLQRGGSISKGFKEEVSQDEASRRLRTALDVRGNWLPGLIREADKELTDIRARGHADAAGLIVAFEQADAKAIAQLVKRITGEYPAIAVSEDPDAGDQIERFRCGTQRWIVAVKMVSEGIDIPRLRVGVYATRIIAELFFRQFVGRVVRWTDGIEEQTASVYIPADSILIDYARRIIEEIEHEVTEQAELTDYADLAREWEEGQLAGDVFQPGTSSEPRADGVIYDGADYHDPELRHADKVKDAMGIPSWVPSAYIAAALRYTESTGTVDESPPVIATPVETLKEIKDRERRDCSYLVSRLAKVAGMEHRELNGWLYVETGAYVKDSTLEQLQARKRLLMRAIEQAGH